MEKHIDKHLSINNKQSSSFVLYFMISQECCVSDSGEGLHFDCIKSDGWKQAGGREKCLPEIYYLLFDPTEIDRLMDSIRSSMSECVSVWLWIRSSDRGIPVIFHYQIPFYIFAI